MWYRLYKASSLSVPSYLLIWTNCVPVLLGFLQNCSTKKRNARWHLVYLGLILYLKCNFLNYLIPKEYLRCFKLNFR